MRYHTPVLLFHIEFASLFNFLGFNSKSTEIVIGCSWPNTALLWSTGNHANCKLHAVNRCCCKMPSFPISPPICQWVVHVVTQPFDLSWARWYWTQPFEPELSQMLTLHNNLILSWTKYLFNTTIWFCLKSDACISTTIWFCVEPEAYINTTVWSCLEPGTCMNTTSWTCLEPDAYMNTTRWTCLELDPALMLTIWSCLEPHFYITTTN